MNLKLKAAGVPDSRFKKSQLRKGLIVEKEHSNNLKVRKAIAKAHLLENPNYYNNPMFKKDLKPKQKRNKYPKRPQGISFREWKSAVLEDRADRKRRFGSEFIFR